MSALNDYLRKFERNLVGVEERKKRELTRDVERHIIAMSEEYGGGEEGIASTLKELGPPEKLAQSYVRRYAAGWRWIVEFSLFLSFISLFTLPVLPFLPSQNPWSLVILPVLAILLVLAGMEYGAPVAAYPAIASALCRSAVFQITLFLHPFDLTVSQSGIYMVHITSLLLLLIPMAFPLPGKE